jgi:hypothetical protein
MTQNAEIYTLIARHGDDLSRNDFTALQTVRRTLLGLQGHGFITDFETYADHDQTVWSYRQGSEGGDETMAGLVDLIRVVAPKDWEVTVTTLGRS